MPASTMSSKNAEYGKLIAVEGDPHSVSTQLRILPPSPKILILPSLLEDLSEQLKQGDIDPRSFIRNVHTAFTERVARARSFIQASTSSQPRFVFMNGGVVAARSTCISYISENYTDGNIEDAEAILNEIVKDGISGLMQNEELAVEDEEISEMGTEKSNETHLEDNLEEDHTARAMRAAETLDRETAALQESTVAFTPLGTPENLVQGVQDEIWNSSSQPYTPRPRDILFRTSDIVRTLVVGSEGDTKRYQRKRYTIATSQDKNLPTPLIFSRRSEYQTCQSDIDDEGYNRYPSTTSSVFSATSPPQAVIFGEARIVDVQPTSGNQLRKAASVDHFLTSDYNIQRFVLDNRRRQRSNSDRHLQNSPPPQDLLESFPAFSEAQNTTFPKVSHMVVNELPRMSLSKPPSTITTSQIYIDRGTDAREEESESSTLDFEPVFPVVEDLVIHINAGSSDPILDSVILSYKTGAYPKFPDSLVTNIPLSPTVSNSTTGTDCPEICSNISTKAGEEHSNCQDEFDPYSSNASPWPRNYGSNHTGIVLAPPTPTITPRPVSTGCSEKFYALSPLDVENVIEVQNSLREILGLFFPRGEESYNQHLFPGIPEADRLWKPVFSNNEATSAHGDSTVDQIIALGCEEGVQQDLFSQISGQVERLGAKRDGANRSGRLDLRYLIGNAMQTLSTSTSGCQSTLNTILDPSLLAELLVPHIEVYLAVNNTVRLLILLYPVDHLSTVISLRTLIGCKLFKIAGVLDSHSCDPPIRTRPRTPTASHPLSNEAFSTPKSPPTYRNRARTNSSLANAKSPHSPNTSRPSPAISFSKANYLLPSIANNCEITAFLSEIWTSLMEVSPYYTPEAEPEPIIVERVVERFIEKPTLPPTPTSPYHPISHGASVTARNFSAKIARLTGSEGPIPGQRFGTPEKGDYASSIASTTMTMRTTGSKRWKTEDIGDGIENFYLEEEDSDDDDWDRMIMGRSGAKPPQKASEGKRGIVIGSKKKALKWLGLA